MSENIFAHHHFLCLSFSFLLGDTGRKFYIIIRGSVNVFVNSVVSQTTTKPPLETSRSSRNVTGNTSNSERKKIDSEPSPHNKQIEEEFSSAVEVDSSVKLSADDKLVKQHKGMFLANKLVAGSSFGEIAIRNKITRTATVTCSEESVFAVLSRDSYYRIISEHDFS
jgi:CRP-like cAMP-binding protein